MSGEILSSVIDELRIETAANSCRSCMVSALWQEHETHAGQNNDAAAISKRGDVAHALVDVLHDVEQLIALVEERRPAELMVSEDD